jgi:hypothetical protein
MKMEKIRIINNLNGEEKTIEQTESIVPQTIEAPIEKTLEEKYEELRALFLEYLEVLNG